MARSRRIQRSSAHWLRLRLYALRRNADDVLPPTREIVATFLVAHGAWSAGWAWKKMRPLLRERGHELFTPTHTGLGERAHLASPQIDLETHIADILGVLQAE